MGLNDLSKYFKFTQTNRLLFVIYLGLFVYLILQPAIYSPDTYSYLGLHVYRSPGYSIFSRALQFALGDYFNPIIVGILLLFGFFAIHLFAANCRDLFKMTSIPYLAVIAVLIFAYFPPLWIGNNICSEGIAYPLYLLLLSFSFDFFFRNENRKWIHLSIVFILLAITRGQFVLLAPMFAFLYILKERSLVLQKTKIFYLLLFLTLPLSVQLIDRSYHKIVHGIFDPTPFSYVNAITLPLFVSKESDAVDLKTQNEREIFLETYSELKNLGLLMSETPGEVNEQYDYFFKEFPVICNQTFHPISMDHYAKEFGRQNYNAVLAEKAAKAMMPVLVKNNLQEYISLLWQGIVRSFYGIIPLILVVSLLVYSFFASIKTWNNYNGLLLFAALLIIVNSFLAAFAAIPIIRYLFYNFFLVILIAFVIYHKIKTKI